MGTKEIPMIEIITTIMFILGSVFGFFVKRLYTKLDETMKAIHEHKVETARTYITRREHDEKIEALKVDIREMVHSIQESVCNIENYIRRKR